jgi:hypothetical protein
MYPAEILSSALKNACASLTGVIARRECPGVGSNRTQSLAECQCWPIGLSVDSERLVAVGGIGVVARRAGERKRTRAIDHQILAVLAARKTWVTGCRGALAVHSSAFCRLQYFALNYGRSTT